MENNRQKGFELKALSKFLTFFFGGFFILVLIVASLVGVYWYLNKDDFAKMAPENTFFYLRINEPFWTKENAKISELNLQELFEWIDIKLDLKDFRFENDILPIANRQMALTIIKLSNNDLGLVVFLKIKDGRGVKKLPYFTPHQLFTGKMLIIADSEETLNIIKEVRNKKKPNLSRKVAKDFFDDDFIKLYLDLEKVRKLVTKKGDLNQKSLSYFLNLSQSKSLFLTLNNKIGHWYFSAEVYPEIETNLYPTSIRKLSSINFLPENFTFFIKGMNLSEVISDVEKIDKDLVQAFHNDLKNFEKLHDLDLLQSLWPLFTSGLDLLLTSTTDQEQRNLDLVVNLALDNYSSEDLKKLPEILKEILAKKYPFEQERVLPDETKVVELVMKPDFFSFDEKELGQDKIYYLQKPELELELAYTIKNNEIIFSSSLSELEKILRPSANQIDTELLNKQCWVSGRNRLLIFNKEELVNNWSGAAAAMIEFLPGNIYIISQDKNLSFSGCIY